MTPPKKNPQKRGPKPKPASERPSQLTVRLQPEAMFGLDVIARDRGVSMNQAVEAAISSFFRGYEVQWGEKIVPLQDIVDDVANDHAANGVRHALGARTKMQRSAADWMNYTRFMPVNLRTKEEQFILDCVRAVGQVLGRAKTPSGELVTAQIHLDDLSRVIDAAKAGFAQSKTVDEVVDPLRPFQRQEG